MIYTNHSGGASGADREWREQGKLYGIRTVDWRPHHIPAIGTSEKDAIIDAVKRAALALRRPSYFKGIELVERNWFPAHHSQAVYAIGHIIPPGEADFKGFINETDKEIVAGGTGWTVEMAIQMNKPVYVFDMKYSRWCIWRNERDLKRFDVLREGIIPILTESFAGIGSRSITPEGVFAIGETYKKTFNYESGN